MNPSRSVISIDQQSIMMYLILNGQHCQKFAGNRGIDWKGPRSGPRRDHKMDGRVKLVNPMIHDFGSVMGILILVK
jgi:hypothetical protein